MCPTRISYIRIHRSDGTVVFCVDVAITAGVIYPVGSLGPTIQFTTLLTFTEKESYYVTMDHGVIFCGAESPTSTDPYTMRIKISTLQVYITDITNNYGQ